MLRDEQRDAILASVAMRQRGVEQRGSSIAQVKTLLKAAVDAAKAELRAEIPWEKRKLLTADHTIASTTATKVTGLSVAIPEPGTYDFEYSLLVQSTAAGTGPKFGVNFTGTASRQAFKLLYASTGTTASTGVAEDAVTATTGGLYEAHASRTFTTTSPDLGPLTGVAAADQDILFTLKGKVVVTVAGSLDLWMGSEGAVQVSTETGSSIIVRKIE